MASNTLLVTGHYLQPCPMMNKNSFPQWFEFFKNQNPLPQSLRKEREHKARFEHLKL